MKRVLTGKHHLALLGLPAEYDLQNVSNPKQVKFAGQAMFVPSIGTMVLAAFSCINKEPCDS